MKRTFIDAGVLVAAARGTGDIAAIALDMFGDLGSVDRKSC